MTVNYGKLDIVYHFSWNKLTIVDSFKIPHRHYHNILSRIKVENPNNPIWDLRSFWSMECEWAVHNLCYRLHINRAKTSSVDLGFKLTRWEKLGYHVLGTLLYIWK